MVVGIALALAAAAVWGVAITVAKPGARYMDPPSFIRGRWIIATALAVGYALITRSLAFPGWSPVFWVAVSAILDALVGWLLYMMAMQRSPAYQVTTLASTVPLWGVLGSILFLGEPLRWATLAAASAVVAGAFFLVGGRRKLIRVGLSGSFFALATGVLWGIAETVPMKLALRMGMTPGAMLVAYGAVALFGILCITPLLRRVFPRRVERRGYPFLLISALCGASIGWLLWINGLRFADASVLSPIRGSTMLFAFIYSVVFLKERPTWSAIAGAGLVFGGVLLVSVAG
jgi:drug/metabolite transporter (DMT)-like permease